jgi:hypothetical protein
MAKDIQSMEQLSAEDVVKKIKEGEEVKNAIISEEIIYPTSSNCEKTIKHDVKINNCIFKTCSA